MLPLHCFVFLPIWPPFSRNGTDRKGKDILRRLPWHEPQVRKENVFVNGGRMQFVAPRPAENVKHGFQSLPLLEHVWKQFFKFEWGYFRRDRPPPFDPFLDALEL